MQLNESEAKYLQKWRKTIERGRITYIITYGLLWGVFVAIFSHLLSFWGQENLLSSFLTTDFLIRLAVFALGGIGMYTLQWRSNYKKYNQLKAKQGIATE